MEMNFKNLYSLLESLTHADQDQRPDCELLWRQIGDFSLKKEEIKRCKYSNLEQDEKYKFIKKYFDYKQNFITGSNTLRKLKKEIEVQEQCDQPDVDLSNQIERLANALQVKSAMPNSTSPNSS